MRVHATQAQEIERLRAELAAAKARMIELDAMLEHRGDEAAEMERMLRSEFAASREREARMRGIGGQLSNVAFNLAQRAGHVISSDDCSLLDGMRKQWHAALAEGAQG